MTRTTNKNTAATGPAAAAVEGTSSQADVNSILAKLDALTEKMEALESLPSRISALERLLQESTEKAASLQAEVNSKDKIIFDMKNKMNSLEQYNRKWSVRINNIHLPNGDETDTMIVMETVYKKALLPILEGAKAKGMLKKIPDFDELLETAHILPAKDSNRPKPIICRFYSRNMRAMIFRLKQEFAPANPNQPTYATAARPGAAPKKSFQYPIYEDLTKDTFHLLQALLNDERTGPVWTVSGNIRYKLAGDAAIKKVSSVYDSVEKILGSTATRK
jgi:hypothetical protein